MEGVFENGLAQTPAEQSSAQNAHLASPSAAAAQSKRVRQLETGCRS